MTPENQKKYDAKVKRMQDALALKTPDRVPIDIQGADWMIKRTGHTVAESNFDETLEISKNAAKKFMEDFDPDTLTPLNAFAGGGRGHEMSGSKTFFIAGTKDGKVEENSISQYVEFPALMDDEFDEFENDYMRWAISKYLPRISSVTEAFANFDFELSPTSLASVVSAFSKQEMRDAIKQLWAIDDFNKEYRPKVRQANKELEEMGYPASLRAGRADVPFDKYSDTFRGLQLGFEDLMIETDFVMRYCEKFQKEQLARLAADNKDGKKTGKLVGMPLHRGSDDMMGNEMYEKYYWCHLKQIIETVAKTGMITSPFCEGIYDNKLKYLADVPYCSAFYLFDKVDIKKAKEIVGKVCPIGGGFPSPLLTWATPYQVEEECKRFLEDAMPGGGYVFRLSAGLNGAKEENVEALFKTLHEYGKY